MGKKSVKTIRVLVKEVGIPVGNITRRGMEMVKGMSLELRGMGNGENAFGLVCFQAARAKHLSQGKW